MIDSVTLSDDASSSVANCAASKAFNATTLVICSPLGVSWAANVSPSPDSEIAEAGIRDQSEACC